MRLRNSFRVLWFPVLVLAFLAVCGTSWACESCTLDEKAKGTCVESTDYVVKVAPDASGRWPIPTGTGGLEYRYTMCAKSTCIDTINYVLAQLPLCSGGTSVDYISGSYPTGAAITIEGCVPKNIKLCTFCAADNTALWKLNPSLNCNQGSTTFSIFTNNCAKPAKSTFRILTKSGCSMIIPDQLLLPGCDDVSKETEKKFGNGLVTVELDRCSQEPKNVVFKDFDGNTLTTCKSTLPYLCYSGDSTDKPPNGFIVYPAEIAAPACIPISEISELVVLKEANRSDSNSLYLWGNTLWYAQPAGTICP